MKKIRVVAAVIKAVNDKGEEIIFATQRGYGELKGGWEFPGGKIEDGELPQEALKREIMEELETDIKVGELIDTIEYNYPTFHLSMDCFWAEIVSGDLVLNEHAAAKWLTIEELNSVEWLPADIALIDKIREEILDKNVNSLKFKYEFRTINQSEASQAVRIEHICFPPNEACSEKNMTDRIAKAPEMFLVAVDKETGKLAGFLNGLATDEEKFRDEFFTDCNLYNPSGKNVMILGLDVLPEYRMQGLGRELVRQYAEREYANKRQKLILTCLDSKVEMYKKMGFVDDGIADSTWGGEEWHEMSLKIDD